MKDTEKTKEQLIAELKKLRHECVELKMKESLQGPVIDQLRKSEERYRHIYENIQDVYYEISLEGIIMELSPSIERSTKYTRAELIGKSVYEIYTDPQEREEFLKAIQKTGAVDDFVVKMKDKDGQLRAVSLCARFVPDEKEVPCRIIGSLRDITERMQDQWALQESEEKYRSVVDNIGIGVALISPKMEILTLNNQMKIWFPHIDVSQKPICYEAYNNPPREAICSYCPTYRTLRDGRVHESVTETPMGSEIVHYRIISSPIKDANGHIIAAIEMVEDITERKEMEERLQESEVWYRTLFETTASATMIIEEDTTISLVNSAFEKQSGYLREEIEGKRSWTEFVAHDDLVKMQEFHHIRRIDPNAAPRDYEFKFVGRNGGMRDAFMTIAMIPGTKKSVASFLDITDRKQAEESLRESEEKYRSLSSTVDSMYLVDRDSRYLLVNERYLSRLAIPLEKIIGKSYGEFHSAEDTRKFTDILKRVFTTGEALHFEHKSEKDEKVFLRSFSPVKDSEGGTTAVTVVSRDITERKRTEETLKRRERELEVKSRNLEELNTALKILLKQREYDKNELEERVLTNVKQLILPYIEKLKKVNIEDREIAYVNIVESNLKDITSSFSNRLSSKYLNFTPREIQIANLIKEGRTTKEIADILNTSPGTVDFHRDNIRTKLNLKKSKANLRSYLLTLS